MTPDRIVIKAAKAFDKLRRKLIGKDAQLLLLRSIDGEDEYELEATLVDGWYPYFSDYYQTTTFQVATLDNHFGQKVEVASHMVVVGAENAPLNNVLFELKRDTQPPFGDAPYWKVRADATSNKYAPPQP